MNGDHDSHLQACIDRMLAGDTAARNELVEIAHQRLRQMVRSRLYNDRLYAFHETDSVLHDVLINLLKMFDGEPPRTVAGFYALAAQHIRWTLAELGREYQQQLEHFPPQGAGQRDSSEANPPEDPGTTTDDPAKLAMWTEIHQKVDNLPEEERKVVDLHYYWGMTEAKVAVLLGISQPEVSRRWLRAARKIKEMLK